MKIRIYVDWSENEILSEKEITARAKEIAESYFNDENMFSDWLDEQFSGVELFWMDEGDKEAVKDSYKDVCKNWAQEAINNDFDLKEIEI